MTTVTKTKTRYLQTALDEKEALSLYEYLQTNIEWVEGIRSRKGFTRLAKSIDLDQYPELIEVIVRVLGQIDPDEYILLGVYLNYYSNGNMWLPKHNHPGTQQLIISLGASRTLTVGTKQYSMSNGSAIIFGSASHGIPKEPDILEGRISIATFLKRI
jgi:hypothetical protein